MGRREYNWLCCGYKVPFGLGMVAAAVTAVVAIIFTCLHGVGGGGLARGIGLMNEDEFAISVSLWLFVWSWIIVATTVVTAFARCGSKAARAGDDLWKRVPYAWAMALALLVPWSIVGVIVLNRKLVAHMDPHGLVVHVLAWIAIVLTFYIIGSPMSYAVLHHAGYHEEGGGGATTTEDEPLLSNVPAPANEAKLSFAASKRTASRKNR